MPDVVVVGVDGSENSWSALDWAVAEATLRKVPLRIVCAFEDPVATVGLGTAFGAGAPIAVDPMLIEDAAQRVVEEAGVRAGAVETQLVARCDSPDSVLIDESDGALMLVVGARGHSGLGGLLLGSVSNHVVHHAKCPVVIVPHTE